MLHGHVLPHESTTGGRPLGRTLVRNVTGRHLLDIAPGRPASARTPGAPESRAEAVVADTGFPRADVENDFQRARRRQVLARLAQRLRREPDDVNLILPFDEVVAALGRRGERSLGLQTIRLDSVVGTVDYSRDFDRRFRPTSGRVRERWERLALAQRRGESIPPIDVYQVGDMYFVEDGHHRVSIALATGQKMIDAYVTEVLTAIPPGHPAAGRPALQGYERMFRSRVPLPAQAYAKITFTDPWGYAELGEAVEAWGFRLMQHEHQFFDRAEIARRWFTEELPRSCACCTPPTWSAPAPTPRPTWHRPGALPADAHPRVERRGHRAPPQGGQVGGHPASRRPGGRPGRSASRRLARAQREVLAGGRVEDVHRPHVDPQLGVCPPR